MQQALSQASAQEESRAARHQHSEWEKVLVATEYEQSFNKCLKRQLKPGTVMLKITPSKSLAELSLWGPHLCSLDRIQFTILSTATPRSAPGTELENVQVNKGKFHCAKGKHEWGKIKHSGSQQHGNWSLNLPIVFPEREQRMVPHPWYVRHPKGEPTSQAWSSHVDRAGLTIHQSRQTTSVCFLCKQEFLKQPLHWWRWEHTSPRQGQGWDCHFLTSAPVLFLPLYLQATEERKAMAGLLWDHGPGYRHPGPGLRMGSSMGSELLWKHWLSTSSILPFIHPSTNSSIHPSTPKCLLRTPLHSSLCRDAEGLSRIQSVQQMIK